MLHYRQQISGFFSHRGQAETAYAQLMMQGITAAQLTLKDTDTTPPATASLAGNHSSNDVLKSVLISGALGVMVGAVAGMVLELSLIAANIHIFITNPLIAPLVLIGWGASLGGLIGAIIAAMKKNQPLPLLIQKSILNSRFVLVAETHTKQQTTAAKLIMETAWGGYKNVRVD